METHKHSLQSAYMQLESFFQHPTTLCIKYWLPDYLIGVILSFSEIHLHIIIISQANYNYESICIPLPHHTYKHIRWMLN